jgi:hypothetical protein
MGEALPFTVDWTRGEMEVLQRSELLTVAAPLAEVPRLVQGRLAYLSTPGLTGLDPEGMSQVEAFEAAVRDAKWARALAAVGVTAISPLIHAVEMLHFDANGARDGSDPLDGMFWATWRRPLFDAAGPVIVPPVVGWMESELVWRDMRAAVAVNRRVILIDGVAEVDV